MFKKLQSDNLFDNKLTMLDGVKVFLLIVSFFSTLHIVDIITPDGPFAWIRILGGVCVVEGGLVAFERAANHAKTERQSKLATLGYFACLIVIITFFLVAGFLEFSGPSLLSTELGNWLGVSWTVNEIVLISALVVIGAWLALLALIARFFGLADPDKAAELERNRIDGDLKIKSNTALSQALGVVGPEIAIQRTLLSITDTYGPELTPLQLKNLLGAAELKLREFYSSESSSSLPPSASDASVTHKCLKCGKEHDGDYHFLFCGVSCEVAWLDESAESNAKRRQEILQNPSPALSARPASRPAKRPERPAVVMSPVPTLSTPSGNGHHSNPTP